MKRWIVVIAMLLVIGGVLGRAAYVRNRDLQGLEAARSQVKDGAFASARGLLRRYLHRRPDDAEAKYLLAECLIKDEFLPPDAVAEAVTVLGEIPDASPLGVPAQSQIARIQLLVLQQPWAAERTLRAILDAAPNEKQAHYLMWKLLDLTARSQESEPHAWRVIEQSVDIERRERLREWYLSQFYPNVATLELDRQFGASDPGADSRGERELTRFLTFQKAEPDGPLGYAGEARWMLSQGDPKAAHEALQRGIKANRKAAETSPLFIAAMIETQINLGEMERAADWLAKWPKPHEGNFYWRWAGVVADEVHDDPERAIEALTRSLQVWPGPVDWRTRTRIANCLQRLRRADEAQRMRDEAKSVEMLVADPLHRDLYARLNRLDNPEALAGVIEFYEQLRREKEVNAWKAVVALLTGAR